MSKKNNLQNSFGKESADKSGLDAYVREEDSKLIKKSKKMLNKSKTGKRLLLMAKDYNINFTVLNNKEITAVPKDANNIIITAPPSLEEPTLGLILSIGVAIRDLEQDVLGFGVPPKGSDPTEIATAIHVKEMDKLITCCAIAYELINDAGITKMLDEIEKMGHIDVYKAYVKEKEDANDA